MQYRKSLVFVCLLFAACQASPKQTAQPAQPASAPKQDFLIANMDTSINPGDDFFSYANGGWIKRNPIPASESAWGIGNLVREELHVQLRTIDETAARKKAASGTDEQKIG